MSYSDYIENKFLDHVVGGPDYTRAATLYVALYTAAPSDTGGGTEVAGNAYARASVTNNATNFPAAAAGLKSNGIAISFPQSSGSWGTVTHFALWDAVTGGNQIGWGALDQARAVGASTTLTFQVGQLRLTQD